MPSFPLIPADAAGAAWLFPVRAVGASDGLLAVNLASGSNGALELAPLDGARPVAGSVILGVTATVRVVLGEPGMVDPEDPYSDVGFGSMIPPSAFAAVELALSLDGSTAATAWRTVLVSWASSLPGGLPLDYSVGGEADLWGLGSLSLVQAGSQGFGLLVRRKASHPGQTPGDVFLDSAVVTLHAGEVAAAGPTAMSDTIRNHVLLGLETTAGTVVPVTRKPNSFSFDLSPEATKATNRPAGQKLASHRPTTRERSTGTIVDSGLGLNYTELAWLLASVIARPQLAQIASGVHQRTFRLNRRTCDDFQTYSAAIGDDCLAPGGDWVTAAYAMINSLGLTFGRNETSISGSVVANRMLQDQARPAGTNEVQTLTLGAVVTGGTLTLLFNGQQIGPIAGSANMQTAMQTAFNTALGAGNMTVGGSGTNYTLTGAGALAGRNLPMVEVAPGGNALTAATTVSIVETTRGGFIEPVIEPVLPGHWEVWMADTLGGLGQEPNRLTSLFQAELSIERGRNPVNRAGRALGTGFARVAEAEDTINLTLSGESAGNLKAARNRSLADAVTYIRLEAVGPVIGATGINHSLQFDLCCKVDEEQGFGDADGVRDVTYRFVPVFDDAWGNALVARLVNGLSGAQL